MDKYLILSRYCEEGTDLCAKHKITYNQLYLLICIHFNRKAVMYKYLEECHPQAKASLFMEHLYNQDLVAFLGEDNMYDPDYAYIVNLELKKDIDNLFEANLTEISYLKKSFEKFFSTYPAVVVSDGKRLTLKAVAKGIVYRLYERILLEDGQEVIDRIQEGTEIGEKNNLINCKITTYLESRMFEDLYKRKSKEDRRSGLDSEKISY